MSVIALLQVQFGNETTWGTPVAGSAKIMGIEKCSFKPEYRTARYPDIRQSLAPGTLGALEAVSGALTISGVVTYEDFPYFLDGLFAKATPSGANPYTYPYTAPTTAAPVPRLFTILWGDSSGTYRLSGGLLSKLTVRGTNNTKLTFDAEFLGELVDGGSLAGLSDRAVNVAMGNHAAVYVDAFAGTIGSTALTATAFEFEWMVQNNRVLKSYLGSIAPLGWEGNAYDGSLKLGLEMNATSKAYLDAIYASSPGLYQRLVRIQMDNTANRQIQLDMAGNVAGGPELWTDRDGVSTVELNIAGLYDAGAFANWSKAKVINQVSALP